MKRSLFLLLPVLFFSGCLLDNRPVLDDAPSAPSWVQDAVFYQIFPERFRNGDPSNDPVRESMDYLEYVPESWSVSEWTKDWYAKDAWEAEKSEDVYASMFDRRFGGDLQGVIDQLEYLQNLGITAIWFNPVFHAASLHKYDGSSFHHIDPHFGPDPDGDLAIMATENEDPTTWQWTAADQLFLDLLAEAKERNIRIILDGVWNHTGRGFFAFQDVLENQAASAYAEWYDVTSFDDPDTEENEFAYASWWGYESLPEFANNAEGTDLIAPVKDYVFAATQRWMDPNGDGDPADGIAGWRLDVAEDVPAPFWRDWNSYVRSINPDAYTVAEYWHQADEFIDERGFSAVMNYHGFAMPVKGFFADGMISADQFAADVSERWSAWGEDRRFTQLNLVDSHDTPRIASMIVNRVDAYEGGGNEHDYDGGRIGPRSHDDYDVSRPDETSRSIQRMVGLFQGIMPGAPITYYGTEAGMWGADDPDDRKPMVWLDLDYEDEQEGPFGPLDTASPVEFDLPLFNWYAGMNAFRHEWEVLRSGSLDMAAIEGTEMGLHVHRTLGDVHADVWFNRGAEAIELPLDAGGDILAGYSSEEALLDATEIGDSIVLQPNHAIVLIREQ